MSSEIPHAEELPTSMLSECRPIVECVASILSQVNAAIRAANEGYRSAVTVNVSGLFPKLPSINGADIQTICLVKVAEELEEKKYQVSIVVPKGTTKASLVIRWNITNKEEEIEEARAKIRSWLHIVEPDA